MKTVRKDYPYDAIIMRLENKQWYLEVLPVGTKEKIYIKERLIRNQDIFHIIVENNKVLNGSNILICLMELHNENKMNVIELIKFNNFTLNIIEITL